MGDDGYEPLRHDPDLFVRIAENALTVAEDLREEYFNSTLGLARSMRQEFRESDGVYKIALVDTRPPEPSAVAFVDGGMSRVDVGLGVPLIVRAGIYRVKQGERDLEKRETFDHFPLMLGQLKGGLKANSNYVDIVREIVELGAMVTALEDARFDDIRMLVLHGPLQFVTGPFFDHWFFPVDYEQMLGLAEDRSHVRSVLEGFAARCNMCELRDTERCGIAIREQHLPAVCMIAFLQQHVITRALEKSVLVCGVVERSFGRSITKHVVQRLLEKQPEVFDRLLAVLDMGGRATSAQAEAILDATRYNDPTLLSLALERGEMLEWYPVDPLLKVRDDRTKLFPRMQTTFVRVTSAKYPMRIEAPIEYGADELSEIVSRSFDHASMLPNYAFPIGLDIIDKFSAVPGWMSKAYKHLILSQYGRLMMGDYVDITDVERLQMMMLTQGDGKRSRNTRPEV